LYERIQKAGFKFPEQLEDWLSPQWESFDLRRNPLTPWLTPEMVTRIRNFETVLNAWSPTIADLKMTSIQKATMRLLSNWRYQSGVYHLPYELKVLQKLWRYRQPEIEGM
jgi:hypothetical protein